MDMGLMAAGEMGSGDGDVRQEYQRHLKRLRQLRSDAAKARDVYTDLSDNFLPRRTRFNPTDRDRGIRRNDGIINNTPIMAAQALASGLMSGVSSPSRPWFELSAWDPEMADRPNVRRWTEDVAERMRRVFGKSNFYNALADGVYPDLAVFGTSACFIDEDQRDIIRLYPQPMGSYFLASSFAGRVDTVYSEIPMTCAQVVERFGLQTCSRRVRQAYERGNYDVRCTVVHCVEPNYALVHGQAGRRGMEFRSVWMEAGSDEQGFLSEGGYHEFPVVAPRWTVLPGETYGSGPGHNGLGDARALQLLEKRKAEVLDKIVRPPMVGPETLRVNGRPSLLPGEITYVPAGQGAVFQPAIIVPPNAMNSAEDSIARHEKRINDTFFANLLLMMTSDERNQRATAREVDERHEEKLLQLGPVLERLNCELFDPAIHRTLRCMLRRGWIPPPPPELMDADLPRVEYVSVMAAAQKMVGIAALERTASFVGSLASASPEALDKLDVDELVDRYAQATGVTSEIIRDQAAVDQIRKGRADAAKSEQLAKEAGAMKDGASAAQTLSQTDVNGDSALNRLLNTLGPAAAGGGFPAVGRA